MTKPFSPDDALAAKSGIVPPEIVAAVNYFLSVRYTVGKSVTIFVGELKRKAADIMEQNGTRVDPLVDWADEGWLDFEPLFREAGWSVAVDIPGYCENYELFWTFRHA